MTTPQKTLALAGWLGLALVAASVARAADPNASGTVEGRVQNSLSGTYLEKVRLTIEGTALETFTSSDGFYRIAQVPAGTVRVQAFYTGMTPHVATVTVAGGRAAQHDIALSSTTARPGDGVVQLSQVVVSTSREMDGAAIAINEQRFAGNMMNVVSADEFGTIAEGSVGEFLKFMPGITIGFEDGDAISVSMNGAPSEYVPITVAGFGLASSNSTRPGSDGASRNVHLGQTSMNNVARVEVAFTPTPEISGAALAGSINLVPRSAFERSRRSFEFSTYVTMRDNERDFGKSPLPGGDMGRMIRPGFTFSYVAPVNKRFGFTLSGGRTSNFVSDYYSQNLWRGGGSATNGAAFPDTTPDRPYLTQYDFIDSMSVTTRTSLSATADFKLSTNDRISLSFQYGHSDARTDNSRMAFFIDQVRPGDFTPTSTLSAPGTGRIQMQGPDFTSTGATFTPTLTYRHDGPVWQIEAGAAHSQATGNVKNGSETGQFWNVYALRSGLTTRFDDIFYLRPGTIQVNNAATGRRSTRIRLAAIRSPWPRTIRARPSM